jgi:hypothetical protein
MPDPAIRFLPEQNGENWDKSSVAPLRAKLSYTVMTYLTTIAVRIASIALLLLAGSSCVTVDTRPIPVTAPVSYWSGWKDIDEGGFEEKGTVYWHDPAVGRNAALAAAGGKGGVGVYRGVVAIEGAEYDLYRPKSLWRWLFSQPKCVPLVTGGHVANEVVLEQAALSGSQVHVSGRQHSGTWPGGRYVEVTRVTPIKKLDRISW